MPLGFTKHQTALHESFTTPKAARGVIDVIAPFQQRARAERGGPWVFAADEFYVNAFGADTPARIPPASDYGDYDMFEDGIGIVRSYVDEFEEVCETAWLPARRGARRPQPHGPLHHRRGHAALPRRHDRGKPPCRRLAPLK